jgi:two-component system KDP operon response regulator KdpE
MPRDRILIIEDDPAITRAVKVGLSGFGFEVITSATGGEGLDTIRRSAPQVVLLDLGLPDIDGLDLCVSIREESSVPVIILTARGAEHEKIAALDSGADDYVTKPFGMGELLARIRVAIRHASPGSPVGVMPLVKVGDLVIDFAAHQVLVKGRPVHLTPTEFKLLETLVRNAGRMSSRRMLLQEVWGPGYNSDTQILRVFINQLRAKLEENPADPQYILTEPGVGYRFCALAET